MSTLHPSGAVPAALRPAAPSPAAAMTTPLQLLFATAVGVVVLNLYASQPLIGLIGPALGLAPATASLVTTLTLLAYAAGLVLLVPLVDLLANRRLIVATLAVDVAALAVAATATSTPVFLAASVLIGLASTAIQMLVPIAAALAAPADRGRVVGNVMSGLMVGILLSRPIASLMAGSFGWRSFYALTAGLIAVLALVLLRALPERRPAPGPRYAALIGSLWTLLRQEPVLRRRAADQMLLMAAFSAFWTTVALRLAAPPFGLGQDGIALFALAGAAGTVVAPLAGRIADRGWSRPATRASHGLVVLGLLGAGLAGGVWTGWAPSLGLLAAAAVLLDAGVVANQILGRHAINTLQPEARGRLNGLYTGLFFIGGSAGAAIAGLAWAWGGWAAICGAGLVFALMASAVPSADRRGA
ncbi:MAG: MFS transporter [Inquilinus limosus]|uniref:MFS transporter n=1 Tax=Inquilinus limosus TaxID=171674 RepID=A0A952KMF4_9PROT|nr:MFS transporter [Inquilinus limosus]